jgi:hypothetical protein
MAADKKWAKWTHFVYIFEFSHTDDGFNSIPERPILFVGLGAAGMKAKSKYCTT